MGEQAMNVPAKKSRPKYEWVILLIIILAGIAVAFGIYNARQKTFKGGLLMSELSELRAAVTQYKLLNKVNPPQLETLAKEKYSFVPGEQPKPYLPRLVPGKDGKFTDPFGNLFVYDAKTGQVRSGTKGFDGW